jgi:hypothetical protein
MANEAAITILLNDGQIMENIAQNILRPHVTDYPSRNKNTLGVKKGKDSKNYLRKSRMVIRSLINDKN